MEKVSVSVIIPTYNRSSFIQEAVDSVLAQSYRDFELIIVDDGSTDETSKILSRYKDQVSIIMTEHSGPSAARNAGIKTAQGEFIAFLDSDDLWLPEKLKLQMNFFHNNPDIFVCQTEETWIRNGVRVNPRKIHKKYSGLIFEHCLPLCIVSPSAVMIHKTVFNKVGLFDESMPACEDYDLWLRISPRYSIHLIETPQIIKRGGHEDQQSKRVAALDRFRIQALCKALESEYLSPGQWEKAIDVLKKKCGVYGNGCLKRGKTEEGEKILRLPDTYENKGKP
jgi:glycosyltransferase involved in cell wall biosynthesis